MNPNSAFDPYSKPESLTEQLLSAVIVEFYRRIRSDAELGPVFQQIIGQRWDAHMARIMRFWLTVTRFGSGYPGRDFMPAHIKHASISESQLPRWLAIFRGTCQDLCQPDEASYLVDIAERMADNLAISLAHRSPTDG